MNTLDKLFDELSSALSEGRRLSDLSHLVAAYDGDDWKSFERYNPVHYARNLVRKNHILEMLIICWDIKQGCQVHDHPENGCLVRILQSEVRERVYRMAEIPEQISSTILKINGISYKQGNEILHDIFNDSDTRAVSLHLYTPPDYKPNYF